MGGGWALTSASRGSRGGACIAACARMLQDRHAAQPHASACWATEQYCSTVSRTGQRWCMCHQHQAACNAQQERCLTARALQGPGCMWTCVSKAHVVYGCCLAGCKQESVLVHASLSLGGSVGGHSTFTTACRRVGRMGRLARPVTSMPSHTLCLCLLQQVHVVFMQGRSGRCVPSK